MAPVIWRRILRGVWALSNLTFSQLGWPPQQAFETNFSLLTGKTQAPSLPSACWIEILYGSCLFGLALCRFLVSNVAQRTLTSDRRRTRLGIMDDRRKGLEEEYFHRKNQEAIEKLRQKMAIAEEAGGGYLFDGLSHVMAH